MSLVKITKSGLDGGMPIDIFKFESEDRVTLYDGEGSIFPEEHYTERKCLPSRIMCHASIGCSVHYCYCFVCVLCVSYCFFWAGSWKIFDVFPTKNNLIKN